jgi:hypothetical protein
MNPELTLIDHAIEAARKLGLKAKVVLKEPLLGRTRADAMIEIDHGDQRVLYAAEVKRHVTPTTFGAIVRDLERLGDQALLVTDYVTPPIADKLHERHIAFLDTAGNAYLERPPLLIWVKGQKPARKRIAPAIGRAFQPGGLQVLFALLCNQDHLNHPYRELAKMANVTHGTVGWVMADLHRLGYLQEIKGKRGTRRLFEPKRLLAAWTEAYGRTLRPRTLIDRFYVPTLQGWQDWQVDQYDAMWGGEPAAAIMTEYLRPGELTIYADNVPAALAARRKFLLTPAPGHTAIVEVRKRFWTFPGDPAHANLVPPVLVYADLLATGDARCIETAQLVYDGYIARLFTEA